MSGQQNGRERRRVMRLDVLWHADEDARDPHGIHLLDLSPLGVRIAHRDPWRAGVVCSVALPPALGTLRLPGRVVWTRSRETDRVLEGDPQPRYESGVEFTQLTSEQQAALALALATFRTAQAGLGDPTLPPGTPPDGVPGSSA